MHLANTSACELSLCKGTLIGMNDRSRMPFCFLKSNFILPTDILKEKESMWLLGCLCQCEGHGTCPQIIVVHKILRQFIVSVIAAIALVSIKMSFDAAC